MACAGPGIWATHHVHFVDKKIVLIEAAMLPLRDLWRHTSDPYLFLGDRTEINKLKVITLASLGIGAFVIGLSQISFFFHCFSCVYKAILIPEAQKMFCNDAAVSDAQDDLLDSWIFLGARGDFVSKSSERLFNTCTIWNTKLHLNDIW